MDNHDLSVKVRVSAETDEARQALAQAEGGVKALGEAATPAAGQVGTVGKSLTESAASADGLGGSLKAVTGPLMALTAGLAGGRAFIDANVGMESLQRTLTQMTGSSAAARAEIDWLRETANRLGIEFEGTSRAWVGLAAAAKGTAMEGEKSRAVFEAVAGSMAVLGKSSADTEGALLAISQMISKGAVSMEEMRQQLGERLPGAMQAAADSMGVATDDLNKMIESGTLLAEDLLPHLAEGLKKTYGLDSQQGIDGTVSAWNRLKNALADTLVYVGESGKVMDALVFSVEGVTKVVRGAAASFELLGKTVGTIAGFLVDAASGPTGAWQRYRETMKVTLDEVAQKFSAADRPFAAFADKQEKITAGAKASSEEARKSAGSWQALTLEMGKTGKAHEDAVKLAEKTVAARKAENKASLDLANALGSEADKRQAGLAAAKSDAAALSQLAQARQRDADAAKRQVAALREAAALEGQISTQRQKVIDDAEKSARAKAMEAEESNALAQAAQQHAAALEVESARLVDNSARVDELRVAHEQAVVALQATEAEHRAGMATQAEVNAAALEAAKASALYRDALNDVTAALARKYAQASSDNDLSQAGVRLAIEKVRTSLEVARATGDEAGMIRAKNELSRLEIQLAGLKADALRLEAEAMLAGVAARREELQAAGELTAAKAAELKAQEAAAKVKQVEAEIAKETASRLRELESATRGVTNESHELDRALGTTNRQLVEVAASADKAAAAYQRLQAGQQGGGGGGGGGGNQGPNYRQMKDMGMSESEISDVLSDRETSDAEKAAGIVKRSVTTQKVDHRKIANQKGFFGEEADRFSRYMDEAMEREMAEFHQHMARFSATTPQYYVEAFAGAMQRAVGTAADKTRGPAQVGGGGATRHEVDIRLPSGEKGRIQTADGESAERLVDMLKRLQNDARRSAPR